MATHSVFLPGESHRGAWWATGHGVAKSWTRLKQLSTHTRELRSHMMYSAVKKKDIVAIYTK